MYPFYYPSSSYAPSYPSPSSDSDYYRALAEERAAREQYVAAQRAQEEARQRAARARAARRAFAAPYSSFHDDEYNPLDLDMDLDGGAYYPQQRPLSYAGAQPYGFASPSPFSSGPYGLNPRQQRALMEEQRRRELLEEQQRREVLELERERRRQEEERLRRLLLEERQREEAERRRMLEEERARRVLEEEKLRRAIEEEKLRRAMLEEEAARRERERTPLRSSQQDSLQSLLRALGFVPAGMDSDSDQERQSRDVRNGRNMRAHTTSPNPRRASAAPRSPIRPTKSDQPSTSPTADTPRPKAPSPAPAPAPATTIPILSPKPAPAEAPEKQDALANPTPAQVSAAEKIQDAYRAHAARTHALKSISTLRTRFLAAKGAFALPTTLDYETPSRASDGTETRAHVTVSVDRAAALPSPSLSATSEHEGAEDPFAHVPKLAYTPTNAPLHAYEEELNRILSALDAVESRGDAGVRAARRELARMVEREAERVERWRGVVWDWWTGREKAAGESQPAPVGEPVVESEVPSAPVESTEVTQPEPTSQERVEASQEPAMQVEPSEPEPVDVEPITSTTEPTPEVAPMEVESQPNVDGAAATPRILISSAEPKSTQIPIDTPTSDPVTPSAEAAQPPTPEIDIPDADVEEPVPPVEIDVEPPSRAEPAFLDANVVDAEPAEPLTSSEAPSSEAPIVEEPEEESLPDRSTTPSLSNDLEADTEMEMDAEPQEVHTPPPGAHTPLVVVDPPLAGLQVGEQQQQQTSEPKRGASPLVDRSWDEFRAYDMF